MFSRYFRCVKLKICEFWLRCIIHHTKPIVIFQVKSFVATLVTHLVGDSPSKSRYNRFFSTPLMCRRLREGFYTYASTSLVICTGYSTLLSFSPCHGFVNECILLYVLIIVLLSLYWYMASPCFFIFCHLFYCFFLLISILFSFMK